MEEKEWIFENGIWSVQQAEIMKSQIVKMSAKEVEDKKFQIFETFLNSLK